MFVQTPTGMVICISIPLILLAIFQMADNRKEKKLIKEKEQKQMEMEKELEELKKKNESSENNKD